MGRAGLEPETFSPVLVVVEAIRSITVWRFKQWLGAPVDRDVARWLTSA
jgi:hypothetical protein